MIVAMQEGADEPLIQQVIEHLVKLGFEVHRSTGAKMTVLGAVGSGIDFDIRNLELFPGVQEVHRISSPYKLAGKSFRPEAPSSNSRTTSTSAGTRLSSWPARARSNRANSSSPPPNR